ncbi:MAG: thiamine diphosphokinase [Eubacterium sp.]|jgi:thiamine pyrophosphokinase|nr:thiamine diphosphokinase [Eubacterium sp.]
MKTVIITGGTVEDAFALDYLKQQDFDYLIAADSGIHFFARCGIRPDEVLGDFDSADPDRLRPFSGDPHIRFHKYRPEKDAVDTELALQLAMERGSTEIHILGGTGTRLDHVLGCVRLLGLAMERGIPCFLADAHNRIRLIHKKTVLKKEQQYGTYVSLIPLTTQVTGVTLTGFKYPLTGHTLGGFSSLAVSNEIVEEEGVIELQDGILVLAESMD